MTSALITVRLHHAAQKLAARLEVLETRLQGDEATAWAEFRETAVA